MKKRANRLLALLVSATMVATPYASVSTVYAENTDAAESTGFADVWETEDSQEGEAFGSDEAFGDGEAYTGEVEGTVEAEDAFSDGEEFGFSSEPVEEETGELVSSEVALADMVAGKAYSVKATVLNSSGVVSGMYAMDSIVVTLQSDGTYLVRMHQTSANRKIMAVTDNVEDAKAHSIPWYEGNGEDGYWFTVPVASLSDTMHFSMLAEKYINTPSKFGKLQTLNFDLSSLAESSENPAVSSDLNIIPAEDAADYTAVDAALASIPGDLSIYTEESVAALTAAKNAVVRGYGKAKQAEVDKMAADLKAAVDGLVKKDVPVQTTELAVTNITGMFNVKKAVLQKDGDGQYLIVTMNSKGYKNFFKGTYEDAAANGNNQDNWIKCEETADGYQFKIPVAEGETMIPVVSISEKYLNNYLNGTGTLERAFYPRQMEINYESKTLTTNDFDHTISLTIQNNVKMFSIAEASLHTVGGPNSNTYKETLELTMGSDSFGKVYVGSAKDAETAENVLAITNRKVKISVKDCLEKETVMSFYSTKNKSWYERAITVSKKEKILTANQAPVPATGVTLDAQEKTLYAGEDFTLVAAVEPKDTTDKLVWTSSDEKVATVDQKGQVTAVGEGTAVITAAAGTVSAKCDVTVKAGISISVSTFLLDENTGATPYKLDGVNVTLTDSEGNVTDVTSKDSKAFYFKGVKAQKEYTLTVAREDAYVIDGRSHEAAGSFVFTQKITKENDGASYSVYFKKDALKAALKKVPTDYSVYEEAGAKEVQAAVAAADVDGTDFAKRDADGAAIEAALSKLVLLEGTFAGVAEPGSDNAGFGASHVIIFAENGTLKAQFIGTQPIYKRLYLGKASQAKKATADDPKMIMGVEVTNSKGETAYQFTLPIESLNKVVTFVANSGTGTRWLTKSLTFTSEGLTRYVEATGITLDKTEAILDAGKTLTLTAAVNPENASYKDVFWKSNNEKAATVKDGVVTGVAEGTAVITVSDGRFFAECKVAVHTFETIPAVAATCTKSGLTEGIKCATCGETLKAQEEVAAPGHKEEIIPGKAATCTRKGLTDGIRCSVCDTVLKAQEEIPALGHTVEILPAVAATCTKDGWTEGKKCSVCGTILTSRKVVRATGHKEEIIPAVAPAPGKTGLTEGKKCSVCGEILEAQKEVAALPVSVSKITVKAKTSAKIAAGKKVQLQVKVAPANADNKNVTWKSSNRKVATVNGKGVVTMKKNAGGKTVVITATAKDGSKVYGKIKLTCMKGSVSSVSISGKKSVKAGKSLTLKAAVEANGKANKKVAWSSSNKKLATVSSKGVVKTFKGKKGTVKITARALDGTGKKATFTIKIK